MIKLTPPYYFLVFILSFFLDIAIAQQIADNSIPVHVENPLYPLGEGPIVFIDEAHHNFHTYTGRFNPFARLLEQDGYQVAGSTKLFTRKNLDRCKILVISNALNEDDTKGWILPNPSAFSEQEIQVIKTWVEDGGRLLLIADHMPFPGAADALAKAFGFNFSNGFAFHQDRRKAPDVFTVEEGSLHENDLTNGLKPEDKVTKLLTFTGSAFQAPKAASPILSFQEGYISLEPDTAWQFHSKTKAVALKGWHQGAYMEVGKGRIVVLGEAAMMTAQIQRGTFKMGFNSKEATQNIQFVLNTIHWLDGTKS